MKKALLLLLLGSFPLITFGQDGDNELIKSITSNLHSKSRSERMVEIGQKFLGKP
jgi:hypothetical protein